MSPGAVKPAQLPRPPPVPVFAAVQSAKQPQRSVHAAIRAGNATNAAVGAAPAVAYELNVPTSPSPSVSLVLAAANLTSDPDSHCGDTFTGTRGEGGGQRVVEAGMAVGLPHQLEHASGDDCKREVES